MIFFFVNCSLLQTLKKDHFRISLFDLFSFFFFSSSKEPEIFVSDYEIVAIAGGRSHSAAVTVDGDVYCWGDSSDGQCGTGSLDNVVTPTLVKITIQEGFCEHGVPRPETPVAIDSISCGATHTLALSVEDEIWAWGCGEQLGFEELMHAPVPRRLESLAGRRVLMVACGDSHSLALLQKAERAPKLGSSPARHRNVSKENIVVQKHFPSMCTKCNKEIYTYTETSDTCIIDTHHECQLDESVNGFESSTVLSDDELPVSHPRPQKLSSADGSSFVCPSPEKSHLGSSAVSTERPDAAPVEQLKPEGAATSGCDSTVENQSSLDSPTIPDSSVVTPDHGDAGCKCEEGVQHRSQKLDSGDVSDSLTATQTEYSNTNSAQTQGDAASDGDACNADSVFSTTPSQDETDCGQTPDNTSPEASGSGCKLGEETSSEGAQKPSVYASVSVESDGEVWKRQSASEEKAPVQFEEKVTSMDRAMSPPSSGIPSRSRTPSTGSVASLSRVRNFVDENQARDYLARQFEDEEGSGALKEPRHSTPRKEAALQPQSSWKSFLPYSSTMMETMKTMTSKALTNIQNTVDSLVGQQNMELGDMSDAAAAAGDLASSVPAAAMTSVMSDSCGSVEFGMDVVQDSRSSEDGRSSQSPPSLSQASPSPDDSLEGRQSLRTLEMKQQNIERRISAGASKGLSCAGVPFCFSLRGSCTPPSGI